jgi:glucose/mannose-6-phosphate isomerase
MMLDNAKKIRSLDKSDMLGTVSSSPKLTEMGVKAARSLKVGDLDCEGGIRFLGLGGSAIGGDFIRDWLGRTIPGGVTVERGFRPSSPIRKDSLIIVCSYSGDTVETLSMLDRALAAKTKNILLMSSGGQLEKVAKKKKLPYLKLSKVPMPRASLPMVISSVAAVLDSIGATKGAGKEILAAAGSCRKFISSELSVGIPTEKNAAKQIAHTVHGFVPIAIAPSGMASVARRWKTQMNENAKQHCFFGTFPEISHNEIVPWLRDVRSEMFVALFLDDLFDDRKLESGFNSFKKALNGSIKTIDIRACGKKRVEAMLNHMLLADFTSVYSAFLSEVDPTPVDEITRFKNR